MPTAVRARIRAFGPVGRHPGGQESGAGTSALAGQPGGSTRTGRGNTARAGVGGPGSGSAGLRESLTACDAACGALAETLDCPLLTCDRRLARIPAAGARIELVRA